MVFESSVSEEQFGIEAALGVEMKEGTKVVRNKKKRIIQGISLFHSLL